MKEIGDELNEETDKVEKERHELNIIILDIIKSQVSEKVFSDINFVLDESYTYDYKIVDMAYGEYQEEDLKELEGYWVDQTTDGGLTGDEFAGTVSIKLKKDMYFQFSYQM